MSYARKEGDNGERIMNSQLWAFDVHEFCRNVVTQNAAELPKFFAPDAVICWHDSNEQLTMEEYIRANCEYPGTWDGKILRIEKTKEGLMTITKISSDGLQFHITSFFTILQGKVTRLDEYYSEVGDAPQWRKDMGIGKPIS